jgi:hypothetical protein
MCPHVLSLMSPLSVIHRLVFGWGLLAAGDFSLLSATASGTRLFDVKGNGLTTVYEGGLAVTGSSTVQNGMRVRQHAMQDTEGVLATVSLQAACSRLVQVFAKGRGWGGGSMWLRVQSDICVRVCYR